MVADKRKKIQKMIDRLNKTCKAYGMEIYVKKTKVMIMNKKEKPRGMQRYIMLNGEPLQQGTRFKCLDSWITEDARSDEEIRERVGMAKAAFCQNREQMRRYSSYNTKMKILNCYVFSVLNYVYQIWTWNQVKHKKVNASEICVLQKDTKYKLEGQSKNKMIFEQIADPVSLPERYDDEKNGIRRTYIERFE